MISENATIITTGEWVDAVIFNAGLKKAQT